MKIYTAHTPPGGLLPGGEPALVREGFSWPAFFLGFFWALWHRLWLVALVLFAASVAIEAGLTAAGADPMTRIAANLGLALFVGVSGNDWMRGRLARLGYRLTDIVAARGRDAAFRRWGDAQAASLL
jgi:hypothetical protein